MFGLPLHSGVGSASRSAPNDWRSSRSGRRQRQFSLQLALAVLAVLGLERIRIDDSLSQLFHSESPTFKLFEQVSTILLERIST